MELDSRIIEGKTPLTCLDIEQAREFEGKECIFSDNYDNFKNIDEHTSFNKYYVAILAVEDKTLHGDYVFKNTKNDIRYRLILPCEWVMPKEHEKKYRPFTGIEFAEKFDLYIGHIIRIRDRPENAGQEYTYKIMFVGYRWYKNMFEVFINGCWIDLLTLFELYEYEENGEWHKFGVEESD